MTSIGGRTSAFIVVSLLYLLTRLYGLTALPIFTDESIYINLAQKVADNPFHPFLFRMEGKQPLFFWLTALALNVFADPLAAGRAISILAGYASLTGIYLIGRNLYSAKHGLTAAFIYVFCPYTLLFDKLAVVDSLLCASGVWMVYVSLMIAQAPGFWRFVALGMMMGLAFFTKSTALLLFPVPVLILLLFGCHKCDGFWKHLSASGLTACLLIAPIYLFGEKVGYFERTEFLQIPNRLALTLDELVSFPWLVWRRNVVVTSEFFTSYLTWPLVLLAAFGFFLRGKKNIALALWAVFPVLAIDAVANGFYSRYFLIAVPPLLLLAAVAILRLTGFLEIKLKQSLPANVSVLAVFLLVALSDGFFLHGNWIATL